MKRTLLAIVPLTCISVSAAAQNEQHNFDGFFVGAKAGILNSFANVDSTSNAKYNADSVTSFFGLNLKTNRHAILGQIFSTGAINIGYGKQLSNNQFYLGAEVSGSAASRNLSMTSNASNGTAISGLIFSSKLATKTRVELNTLELDLDFKPGVVINPITLIYGRIGAAFNRIQTTSSNHLNNTVAFFKPLYITNNSLNLSSQKNVVGLRVGLGAEYFIMHNITATADYVFTWYGNGPNLNGATNVANPLPIIHFPPTKKGLSNNTSSNMYAQSFMLGLNYFIN